MTFNQYGALIVGLCLAISSTAQKHDYVWLGGYESDAAPHWDTAMWGFNFGNSKLDYNYDTVHVDYDSLGMYFNRTNVSFSTGDGALLMYSNGIYAANKYDEHIEGGDSLNDGYFLNIMNTQARRYGYQTPQGMLALSAVSNPDLHYLFHSFVDSLSNHPGWVNYSKLLVTLVDMSANSGHGKVLYKNRPIIEGDSLAGEVMATKHANGRDWWILIQKRNTNCYYRILLDNTGPHLLPNMTCAGEVMNWGEIAATCFSPDGSKYVCLCTNEGLDIYDFDRCEGTLANSIYLPLPVLRDSDWICVGAAMSSNSRFLYTSITKHLYQFDLWDSDVFSSIDTIGIYNGEHLPQTPGIRNLFDIQQLAPDGKIYMSCGNAVSYFHVINNPDEKGALCNFSQNGLHLPALANSVPNFPNYRLGALTGSACDTLTTVNGVTYAEKEKLLKVFPNPATDVVTIDYGFIDWNKGEVNLEIANEQGRLVYAQHIPMYSGFQKINVAQFVAGLYSASIKRNDAIVVTAKFTKQ